MTVSHPHPLADARALSLTLSLTLSQIWEREGAQRRVRVLLHLTRAIIFATGLTLNHNRSILVLRAGAAAEVGPVLALVTITSKMGGLTMVVLERLIQQIRADKWNELEALDKKYNAVESRFGFPAKRRYRCVFGANNSDTLIIERQWESMAAMEAAYDKVIADPEWNKLGAEGAAIVESNREELYFPLP